MGEPVVVWVCPAPDCVFQINRGGIGEDAEAESRAIGRLAAAHAEEKHPVSVLVISREELTGHIDDPVCTCARCHPEWHTGVRCNCPVCVGIRAQRGVHVEAPGWPPGSWPDGSPATSRGRVTVREDRVVSVTAGVMRQEAPFPSTLADLVGRVRYRKGWSFRLVDGFDRGQGSVGLTLVITVTGPDSYHPETTIGVNHLMVVPAAAFDVRSWQRWLFEQVLRVERHEAMEWFRLVDVPVGARSADVVYAEVRPYGPSHGPGSDPYLVREVGTDVDRRTSFRGQVSDK